ncbi:hypothetical protein BJY04DRAFT_223195 [Aspergillus karnatakaensis]|uniref:uncharacterized protein n=1 Tax=Aspergillus karnatakaensis TaxID=1810916 RepID=UPI003CCDA579
MASPAPSSAPSKPITPAQAQALTFYDISMRPPLASTSSAPNPWKSRLALNYKQINYKTTWVPLPDIKIVRKGLDVPSCRRFSDGGEFHTLPILVDPNTGEKLGDSFDIAVYLQERYHSSGSGEDLFPRLKLDFGFDYDRALIAPLSEQKGEGRDELYTEYIQFNQHVDAAFSAHVLLMLPGLPFPDPSAAETQAEFVRRAGVSCWDDFIVSESERQKLLGSLEGVLGDLARLFERHTSGPFLLGNRVSYADFIVGAWLRMMSVTLPGSEWEMVRGWHGGVFGGLFDGLGVYMEVR